MDPLLVEVEAERFGSAVAEGEGGGGFGGVGEPVQLGEPDRAVGGLDVAEHAAGADRGELLVVTDQPDTAAPADDELARRRPGRGCRPCRPRRSPPRCRRPDPRPPSRAVAVCADGPGEFGEGVGVAPLIWSRSCAAAAAEGASPMTLPPPLVQAVARARRAVVFPAPAGAMASCSRAPEVAIDRDQRRPGRR